TQPASGTPQHTPVVDGMSVDTHACVSAGAGVGASLASRAFNSRKFSLRLPEHGLRCSRATNTGDRAADAATAAVSPVHEVTIMWKNRPPANIMTWFIASAALAVLGSPFISTTHADVARVKNVVLGHGGWADGSGWKGVDDILDKGGYNVSIVQEPETSFEADVSATKRVLAQQHGSCILVAHSYGGAVITEAGTDPAVAGLVYIAAHMPDHGESEAEDGHRFPSDLSKSDNIRRTADGFTYLDPAQFHAYFAADLPADEAAFMSRSQVLNAAVNFQAVISNPAWRTKPSWMLVAGA